jgi:small subunit ribosomal protein S9
MNKTTVKRMFRKNIGRSKNKRYIYAVGRRKSATAILKLFPNWTWNIKVSTENLKEATLEDLFGWNKYLIEDALYPFYILWDNLKNSFDAEIVVKWGGLRWQAEAIRLAFARALVEYNPEFRSQLKPYWLLKRDPREKERKKYWLKKARRAPQWSKR